MKSNAELMQLRRNMRKQETDWYYWENLYDVNLWHLRKLSFKGIILNFFRR